MKVKYGWLYLSATIISTVIGAGFATGQEILSFFNVYGKWSILGFLVVYFVCCFSFETVLLYCFKNRIDHFSGFLASFEFGDKITFCIEGGIALFSFCGFCAMASATGMLFSQMLGIGYMFGVVLMIVICACILLSGIQAIAKVNLILAPLICIGLIWFSVCGLLSRSVETFSSYAHYIDFSHILRSALIYASYNILSAVVVLCSMRNYCTDVQKIKLSCALGVGVLIFVALSIWMVISVYINKVKLGEIPMLDIVLRGGVQRGIFYCIFLFASILTTAIGCGYAVLGFFKSKIKINAISAVIMLSFGALPVCLLGFSGIVRTFYSFFGYVGLPFILFLIYVRFKTRKN